MDDMRHSVGSRPLCRRPPTTTHVIAALARTSFSLEEAENARRLLAANRDWIGFVEISKLHGVVPLVWHGVSSVDALGCVPDAVAKEMARYSRSIGLRNIELAGECARIIGALADSGIEAIPLRGVALAATLYGDVSLRSFGDLDILVQPSHVDQAIDVLRSIDVTPEEFFTGRAKRRLLRTNCEWHFVSAEDTSVELHWRIFPRKMHFARLERDLFSRSRRRLFMGREISVLSDVDTSVMLSIHHGGKHRWCDLRHVCDFAQFVRDPTFDWAATIDRAVATGALRYILTGCAIVEETLGDAVPLAVRDRLARDRRASEYARDLATRLFGGRSELIRQSPVVYYIRHRDRLRDKLRYLPWLARWLSAGVFLPTEKEQRYIPLPRRLRFLLVPFRLLRLTGKYAGRELRRLVLWIRSANGSKDVDSGTAVRR